MEMTGINSSNSFDMSSFLEKANNKNNIASVFNNDESTQSGVSGISATGFLDKASGYDKMGKADEQTGRLNNVLAMAMAGQDVSGLLENVQSLSALEAAETTLDEINADIEEKAQEAMHEDTAIEEQISTDAENIVAADVEGQVSVDADGTVSTDTDGTVSTDTDDKVSTGSDDKVVANAGEQPVNDSSNSSDTAKPTQESVDLYV